MKLHEPFGICQNYAPRTSLWSLRRDLDAIARLGVRWLRTVFDWRNIEPRKGELHFEWYDAFVRMAAERRIHLLPVVLHSPKWVAPRSNFPPDARLFATFLETLVRRYRQQISYWEIWNEANSYFFWVGGAPDYSALLRAGCAAAKRAAPDCKILMCGLADARHPNPDFTRELLSSVRDDCVDIVNLHAYPGTWNERLLEDWLQLVRRFRDELTSLGIDKPIWVTETGLSSMRDGRHQEMEQASYLVKAYACLLGSGVVERVFWWRLKDAMHDGSITSPEERFGLVDQTTIVGGWRPAHRAYSKLSRRFSPRYGGLAGKFFVNKHKPAYRTYATLVRLLGQSFESGRAEFEGGHLLFSFSASPRLVSISWKPDGIQHGQGDLSQIPVLSWRGAMDSRHQGFSQQLLHGRRTPAILVATS